jgi:hypothetical protein
MKTPEQMKELLEHLKKESFGYPEIWKNKTIRELEDMVVPEFMKQGNKNRLEKKVMELAIRFLRVKFDEGEMTGSIHYEVSKAIEHALMCYAYCGKEEN